MISYKKTTGPLEVADYISAIVADKLKDKKSVFLLFTGGSGVDIGVEIAGQLSGLDLSNLTATLTDERYGPVGHPDSNWQQLSDKGLSLPGAELLPVLSGKPAADAAKQYSENLKNGFEQSDYSIGLIGVGPDSHIAGIKPLSPAIEAKDLATYYKWDDFERLTMTFPAILRLDTAVSYIAGAAKKPAFETLRAEKPLAKYPSQILKQVKQAIIFNDIIGEEK